MPVAVTRAPYGNGNLTVHMLVQALDGTTEWQTFLEPEVDEGYAGVAVWGSMFPIDPIRQQVSHLQPVELMCNV